jgi:hypothetical protein
MKEKPILFSGPMVRSILEGKKTQTRRIIKTKIPIMDGWKFHTCVSSTCKEDEGKHRFCDNSVCMEIGKNTTEYFKSKYYQGDRLWIRETFSIYRHPTNPVVHYRADCGEDDKTLKWKPSIFMPRWASRINLEVTWVRVERLQDISEEDAKAEGVIERHDVFHEYYKSQVDNVYRRGYAVLWESINGAESWKQNPWVWVVEFKVVK